MAICTLPGDNPDRGVIPDVELFRTIDDYRIERDIELGKAKELIKDDMSRS